MSASVEEIWVAAPGLREGDVRLSGPKGDDRRNGPATDSRSSKPRKDRSSPVGRALRSVYDDTLREDVPIDFMDLIKKLD